MLLSCLGLPLTSLSFLPLLSLALLRFPSSGSLTCRFQSQRISPAASRQE
jgi:hypothetical protein